MTRGKGVQARNQVALRELPERVLRRRPQICRIVRQPDTFAAENQDGATRVAFHAERCRLAIQENGRAGPPFSRRVLPRDPTPFSFCPGSMRGDKRFRFAPGAAARDGDPQRTIRLDADDVFARAALPYKLNDEPFAGGNDRRRLVDDLWLGDEKREIQLQASSGYTLARHVIRSWLRRQDQSPAGQASSGETEAIRRKMGRSAANRRPGEGNQRAGAPLRQRSEVIVMKTLASSELNLG
jgi:hypothetical protein